MKGDYWCPPTPHAQVDIYHVDELYTVWGGLNGVWRGIQSYDGRGASSHLSPLTLYCVGLPTHLLQQARLQPLPSR